MAHQPRMFPVGTSFCFHLLKGSILKSFHKQEKVTKCWKRLRENSSNAKMAWSIGCRMQFREFKPPKFSKRTINLQKSTCTLEETEHRAVKPNTRISTNLAEIIKVEIFAKRNSTLWTELLLVCAFGCCSVKRTQKIFFFSQHAYVTAYLRSMRLGLTDAKVTPMLK